MDILKREVSTSNTRHIHTESLQQKYSFLQVSKSVTHLAGWLQILTCHLLYVLVSFILREKFQTFYATQAVYTPQTFGTRRTSPHSSKMCWVAPLSLCAACIHAPPSARWTAEGGHQRDRSLTRGVNKVNVMSGNIKGKAWYLFYSDGKPSVRHKLDFHLFFRLLQRDGEY